MCFRMKLVLVLSFAVLAYSMPLPAHEHGREPVPQCDQDINDCSTCYDALVNEVIVNDRNRVNLQRAFFPPESSNPVFVTVTYVFTRNLTGDGSTNYLATGLNETWFWTQSTFYLFQPIETLQYTSLLFTDTSLRKGSVKLYLQPSCNGSDREMMKLLTQRLKIYAMEQSIAATIDDDYNAKGESLETLKDFHADESIKEGEHLSRYTLSFQLVFPIVVIFFLGWLFYHFIENNNLKKFRESPIEVNFSHTVSEAKPSSRNMSIIIMILSSFTFNIYVLVFDCIAIGYRNTIVNEVIYFKPTDKPIRDDAYGDALTLFQLEYAIPILMFFYDFFILAALIVGVSCVVCGLQKKWYYILLSPLSCIVNHSYHILIGFIHTPHHATSILIFYGIVIIVFMVTLRAAYYNFSRLLQTIGISGDQPVAEGHDDQPPTEEKTCMETVHDHILKQIKACTAQLVCMICLLSILSIFVSLFVVYVVILFILVPINMAIDAAPEGLLSINQTILIFFGAAVTYKIYRDRHYSTILDHFVNAQDKIEKSNPQENTIGDWQNKNRNNKREAMASVLLKGFYTLTKTRNN